MKRNISSFIYALVILITFTMISINLLPGGKAAGKDSSPSWSYGQPFATGSPTSGSSYKPISSNFPVQGNTMFNNLKPPYPTNNWFINLLLGKGEAGCVPQPGNPCVP